MPLTTRPCVQTSKRSVRVDLRALGFLLACMCGVAACSGGDRRGDDAGSSANGGTGGHAGTGGMQDGGADSAVAASGGSSGADGGGGTNGGTGGGSSLAGLITACASEPRSTSAFCSDTKGAIGSCEASRRVAIRSSGSGVCGLRTDGTIACWASTLLTDEVSAPSARPFDVPDIDDAIALSVGTEHACAVRADRSVWCWGDNQYGRLGAAPNPGAGHPRQVTGIADVVAIDVSGGRSCAVRADGTLWCWGQAARWDDVNQRSIDSTTPLQVDGVQDAIAIAGQYVLRASGEVLYRGNWSLFSVPGLSDATAITSDACALRASGEAVCWAPPFYEGDAWTELPAPIANVPALIALSTSGGHACGLTRCGQVICWGHNTQGQVGSEVLAEDAPATIVPGIDDAIAVEATGTCALRADGRLSCWGSGNNDGLGAGPSRGEPAMLQLAHDIAAIDIAGAFLCTLSNDGELIFAGEVPTSQSTLIVPYATTASRLALTDVERFSSGNTHACATRSNGTVACWGGNYVGELGDGTTNHSATPVDAMGIEDAVDVGAGRTFTCVLRSGGGIKCWGSNHSGELGNGTDETSLTPTDVIGISEAVQLSVTDDHACARMNDGSVACWGDGGAGQLGYWVQVPVAWTPMPIPNVSDAIDVSVGRLQTCVLRSTGVVTCWGMDGALMQRQLAMPSRAFFDPYDISGLTNPTAIAATDQHACALQANGHVKCWGDNAYGQLGDRSFTTSAAAVEVIGVANAIAISTGRGRSCAVLGDHTVTCWGHPAFMNGRPYTPIPIDAIWHAD